MLTKASLSAQTLASVLEQSTDCVKLIDLQGGLVWMNGNGLCAMEIDDFDVIVGKPWAALWPGPLAAQIDAACERAATGETVRFNAAAPTPKGTPRSWEVSVSAVRDEHGSPAGFVAISRDVTQAQRDRDSLQILLAEMAHRLRNNYSVVCSLINGVARGNVVQESFAKEISTRIMALGAAQSLFDCNQQATDLATLIDLLMAPFVGTACTIDTADVPTLPIGKEAADVISLVVGELSVNSGKHGALTHGGSVDITAKIDGKRLHLEWRERAHKPVQARSREGGQGLALIDRIVTARRGSLTTTWHETGLTAALAITVA